MWPPHSNRMVQALERIADAQERIAEAEERQAVASEAANVIAKQQKDCVCSLVRSPADLQILTGDKK